MVIGDFTYCIICNTRVERTKPCPKCRAVTPTPVPSSIPLSPNAFADHIRKNGVNNGTVAMKGEKKYDIDDWPPKGIVSVDKTRKECTRDIKSPSLGTRSNNSSTDGAKDVPLPSKRKTLPPPLPVNRQRNTPSPKPSQPLESRSKGLPTHTLAAAIEKTTYCLRCTGKLPTPETPCPRCAVDRAALTMNALRYAGVHQLADTIQDLLKIIKDTRKVGIG